jgi:hypothetical protein
MKIMKQKQKYKRMHQIHKNESEKQKTTRSTNNLIQLSSNISLDKEITFERPSVTTHLF